MLRIPFGEYYEPGEVEFRVCTYSFANLGIGFGIVGRHTYWVYHRFAGMQILPKVPNRTGVDAA